MKELNYKKRGWIEEIKEEGPTIQNLKAYATKDDARDAGIQSGQLYATSTGTVKLMD